LATDSYLRLLPAPIAQAIALATSVERHAFAIACARVAVDFCGPESLDGGPGLAELRERALAAVGTADAPSVSELLARRDEQLYAQLSSLAGADSDVSYSQFVRLSSQRHAVRALRATLGHDGLSAAARAAFAAVAALRREEDVLRLARELLPAP
jgi:hypothetical protein